MNAEQLIKARGQNDYCVYFGSPNAGEDGQLVYTTPVELNCIWIDSTEIFRSKEGKEISARAKVFLAQDISNEGMLYHGRLDDLSSSEQADPLTITEAYEIQLIKKLPQLSKNNNIFVRVAML